MVTLRSQANWVSRRRAANSSGAMDLMSIGFGNKVRKMGGSAVGVGGNCWSSRVSGATAGGTARNVSVGTALISIILIKKGKLPLGWEEFAVGSLVK